MKNLEKCKTRNSGKVFSRSEKGKTFRLQSDKDFVCEVVDIDRCVLKDEIVRRCDWLFLIPSENKQLKKQKSKAIYVELKGVDIESACQQLFNAIDKTKAQIPNYDFFAKVVAVKGFQPEILNNEYYRKIKRAIGKNVDFHKVHKSNSFTYVENI